MNIPQICRLCPRQCGVDRNSQSGFCQGGNQPKVARAALHAWEEPCISGTRGSGTVFFSGCALHCCFCQNYQLSAENFGREITAERLAEIFLTLQEQGAHNINLVNPTHYLPWIVRALALAKPQLTLPVVYNSGGYERVETLQELEGLIDIYLPDLKFIYPESAARYTAAKDYFVYAASAIQEMFRQTGQAIFTADGLMRRGLIVRHLALPKGREESKKLLRWIAANLPVEQIRVSLMSQYTPFHLSREFPEINRKISSFEYRDVLAFAQTLGLQGYMQERSAASEEYTPPFDLTGV